MKSCQFSCLTLSPDSSQLFAVGSDRTVKQISCSRIVQEIDLHSFDLTAICLSSAGNVLVAGSSTGATQLFDFPLSLPGSWKEWKMHGDAINFIKMTETGEQLVTGSRDGSFCIWDIWSEDLPVVEQAPFRQEILITKSELEEKNNLIEELKQKVDESKTECAYQLRLKDNQNADTLKEFNRKAGQEKQGMSRQVAALSLEIENLKKGRSNDIETLKKENERSLIDQSGLYKSKLVVEYSKYDELLKEYNSIKESSVKKVENLENSIEKRIDNIKTEFDNKLAVYEGEVKTRERNNEEKIKSMEEILKQTEEDADKEILEMKTKYERDLKHEREALVKVRGEMGILKKKHLGVSKELDSQKDDIEWMSREQSKFKSDLRINEKDKLELKREMKARDNTIMVSLRLNFLSTKFFLKVKEREITDLKRELRHSENAKFVFQHKIKVLQDEIKPKEENIADLKLQILDMERELTRSLKG